MKHYIVYSPVIETYSFNGIDPPEYGACAVEIEAENKRDAKSLALKTKEMQKWVGEARDNYINPFSGLKAEHLVCPHGFCDCCTPEKVIPYTETGCLECDKEMEDWAKIQEVI